MTITSLHGIPQFLRFSTTYPTPDALVANLRTTAFGAYGARTCSVWTVIDDDLVVVAQDGHTAEEADRYSVLPGALDLLIWRAVRSGTPLITDEGDAVLSTFATIDEQYWQRTLQRVETASVVRAPLLHRGQPVGALGLLLDQPWPGDATAIAVLDIVRNTLALWLTSPESGARAAAEANRSRSTSLSLAFSDRQKQILRLVEQDASTPKIALTLMLSESTVKQDLQQAMRALNTRSRSIAAARARELGLL